MAPLGDLHFHFLSWSECNKQYDHQKIQTHTQNIANKPNNFFILYILNISILKKDIKADYDCKSFSQLVLQKAHHHQQ